MDRLTNHLKIKKLQNFRQCQLCGKEDDDICVFRFWIECDEDDNPEPGNVFLMCREGECRQRLEEHPRLYDQVPWGHGRPGFFTFLCEDCPNRDGVRCTHPDTKENGGEGILVMLQEPHIKAHVCFSDGSGGPVFPHQAVECAGHPTKRPK